MSKFEIGDYVMARNGRYDITNENAICKVINNYGNRAIEVLVIDYLTEEEARTFDIRYGTRREYIGNAFTVDEDSFDFAERWLLVARGLVGESDFAVGTKVQLSPSARMRGKFLNNGFIYGEVTAINDEGYLEIICCDHSDKTMVGKKVHWISPDKFVAYTMFCMDDVSFEELFD